VHGDSVSDAVTDAVRVPAMELVGERERDGDALFDGDAE